MTEARVEFDYVAQQSDELTINKGEIITNIKQMDGGWWEGNLRGKRGVFPDNFVKVLNPVEDKNAVIQNKGGARYCRALFSYTPVNEDELELHENDVIEITGEVEEGWWRGVLKGKDGVFPSNFVKEEFSEKVKADTQSNIAKKDSKLDSNEPPTVASRSPVENESLTLLPKPNREMCRVRFPYLAVNADELTLDVGDVVTILSHNTQEPGWWKGELNGKIGVFPDNFVEIISPDEKSILSHTTKVQVNTATNPLIKTTVSSVSNIEPQSTKSQDEICSKGSSDLKPQPLGKKPAVLPPYKKPPPASALTKLSPGPPLSKPSVGSNVDTVDGTTQSRQSSSSVTYESPASTQQSPPLVTNQNVTESPQSSEFDNVERTAMLSHPTVTRAKAPRRRPPSAVFKDSANVTMSLYQNEAQSAEWSAKNEENMFNGNVESMRANENDVSDVLGAAFSTAAPTTNVPTREFERSAAKILLVEELRQNQARNRKTQMEPPQPPATEKKPSLPLTLPTKPSEARLKPVPAQPPQVSSRSSQSDSSLLPPLSIPRRTSPSAEIATPPLHSVTLKRHSENVSQTKPANGFKPFSESQPVASQRPSSAALLRDGEIQKRPSGVVLNRDNETQEQDKITKLEQQVQEMQNTITRMAERFENAIKDERLKRIALEAEVERLKALASVV